MSSVNDELSLQGLFSRALSNASEASGLPTIDDATQDLVHLALADLGTLTGRISTLHIFSKNETLDDIATRDLIYLTVPFVFAEVELNARASNPEERALRLRQAQGHFRNFVDFLESYEVIPENEQKLHKRKASDIMDAAKRRDLRITQFKQEKDLKNKIETLRRQQGHQEVDISNTYNLVSSLLNPATKPDDEDEDDDVTREILLLLLRLQWAQVAAHVESMDRELELLKTAPLPENNQEEPKDEDDTWKLDSPSGRSSDGPLLDSSGRPLRNFVILPSERSRLQAQVFRPDHRLPTMTIDQYLEGEKRRGNIISGGGPQSEAAPTRKEQLEEDSQLDGTSEGDRKIEEKREEDERWARFTDENPRGAGNTMNRG
ncbi:serine/threonine protein phosphatase PP2A-associated protein [Rickenella mellea]|uniref:Serine/threonine protein phosphatase PP2A-associated protein n=1 Tax=Rickenella mellea TaxID=50990 RepID=A0A4Y7QCA5_9AGAM|nr:serine/threonine protein phosphatase PP2A-associated protein [Rickenella mellea]